MEVAQSHLTRSGRLLALLLVLVLSVGSLTGQAATDSCAADGSGTAEVEMLDHADPGCAGCAAMTAAPLVIAAIPDTLADSNAPVAVEFIASPPGEPPRP
ncbi:MAG: hypothetical protein ACQEUN_10325 [Pseudomonadota bacterium]